MSKILLASVNVAAEPYAVYPLGMAAVASALTGGGHEVRQFDYLAAGGSDDALLGALEESRPDFVGLSLRNIDNVDSSCAEDEGWYLPRARRLAKLVRTATTAPLIVGGAGFSLMPEALIEYLEADYGVVGEGEQAACEVISTLAGGGRPPRLTTGSPLPGPQVPSALLEPSLVSFYASQGGHVGVQTKRGCPHRCAYCSYPLLEGRRLRLREPGAVADDIERLLHDHGVGEFAFTDSTFNDPQGHYLLVAEELLQRRLPVRWCAFFRPQGLGRQELALLKRSGLYAVEFGTDAASDATLSGLDKGFAFAEALEANRACVAEGIAAAHFIMFGGPSETEATLREGLINIDRLEGCVVFAYAGIRILPGTGLYQRALSEGLLSPGDSLLKPVYYQSPAVEPAAIDAALNAAFNGRHDRIYPPTEGSKRLAVLRRLGYRGILWDKLVALGGRRSRLNGRRAPRLASNETKPGT
jgi:lipid biosynthesis B12-binding/radical SAM protein